MALGIVKDRDLAWDVSQEAFVRVHAHLAEFKGESSFSTWVLRIGSHLAIDALRKERSSSKEDIDEVRDVDLASGGEGILATGLGNDPQQNLLRRELATQMTQALAQLPEKHRIILVLREELSERLEIPKGTVMSRLFHARTKMQVLLRRYAGIAKSDDGGASPAARRGGDDS